MMTTETLIEQNNRTVSLLEAKDFSNACWASAEALSCQKETINSHPNLDDNELTDALDRCTLCSQNGDDAERTYDIEGNTFFIYDQGILLSRDALENQYSTSAILIFNAALAHQLCASNVSPGDQSAQELLIKAKSLYELAFKFHVTSHNTVFQFAILNNLAVIERILGNGAASNEYLDHLLSFWMCSLAVNHPHHRSQPQCLQGFLWNVLGGKENTAAAA